MKIPIHEKFEHLEFDWYDCTCNFKCPYCGEYLQLSDEKKICDCGHIFELVNYVAEIIPDT